MFKYALIILAVAVSMSLSLSVPSGPPSAAAPSNNEPSASASIIVHKKQKPEKIVFVADHKGSSHESAGLLESGVIGLLQAISIPKKILVALVGYLVQTLKNVNIKKLIKTSLVAGLITVVGAVGAAAVAALVSVISGVCAALPYIKYLFGGVLHKNEPIIEDSHLNNISEFVYSAFDQYDKQLKA